MNLLSRFHQATEMDGHDEKLAGQRPHLDLDLRLGLPDHDENLLRNCKQRAGPVHHLAPNNHAKSSHLGADAQGINNHLVLRRRGNTHVFGGWNNYGMHQPHPWPHHQEAAAAAAGVRRFYANPSNHQLTTFGGGGGGGGAHYLAPPPIGIYIRPPNHHHFYFQSGSSATVAVNNNFPLVDFLPVNLELGLSPSTGSSLRKRRQREEVACDPNKRCSNRACNTNNTPMWRKGPLGPKTLCNACGIKYRKLEEKRKADQEKMKPENQVPHNYLQFI